MKILVSGIADNLMSSTEDVTVAPLSSKTPYEFETIIVDPERLGLFIGGQPGHQAHRWHEALSNWLNPNHRLIVMLRPYQQSGGATSYGWIPLTDFPGSSIKDVGQSHYFGDVVADDPFISNFLRDHEDGFEVVAHFTNQPQRPEVVPNAVISGDILSSFTWREGDKEVIFIPPITSTNLWVTFVNSLDNIATKWKIEPAITTMHQITELDTQIAQLQSSRQSLESQLMQENSKISQIIEEDIYLSRAIRAYDKTLTTEHPNPQHYYEAIESIEKAFDSETDMRETLDVSKNFVGKVTRRANDFRHVAKDGGTPTPLTSDEVSEFSAAVEEIIKKYLKLLYDKD